MFPIEINVLAQKHSINSLIMFLIAVWCIIFYHYWWLACSGRNTVAMNLSCNVESDMHKYNHALPLAAQSMVVCLTEYMQLAWVNFLSYKKTYLKNNMFD